MKKLLLLLLIFLTLSAVSAGNNTTDIPNPTHHIENTDTVIALESGDSNISFSDNYKGYCIEWGEHSAEKNEVFYTNHDVDNNIKVFFVYFYNEAQEDVIATQHMIWKFTDNKQFSRFNQTLYEKIITKAKTVKVPNDGTLKINNTTEMVFSFRNFIAQYEEYQNYFGYKIYFRNITNDNITHLNETTINNSTNTTHKIDNYLSNNQSNKTIIKKYNKSIKSSIQKEKKKLINNHICGASLKWIFNWIIILLSLCLILNIKK